MRYLIPLILLSAPAYADECSPEEAIRILALTMYHEARGEEPDGMQMVGEVVLNRVESVNYPNNVCSVVYARSQFYSIAHFNDPIEEPAEFERAMILAEDLMHSEISYFNNGATYFLTEEELERETWAHKLEIVGKIGDHIFLSDGSESYAMYMTPQGEHFYE